MEENTSCELESEELHQSVDAVVSQSGEMPLSYSGSDKRSDSFNVEEGSVHHDDQSYQIEHHPAETEDVADTEVAPEADEFDRSAIHQDSCDDVDPFEERCEPGETTGQKKVAISPIEWDRISDEDSENRDELQVDAPSDEFYREEEDQKLSRSAAPPRSPEKDPETEVKKPLPIPKGIFKSACYFMIKSNNFENVDIAKTRSVWSTTKGNESRLNKAFFDYANVLLIFSVRESGKFQGFARICASSDPRIRVNWVLPPRMNSSLLSSPFRIEWISKYFAYF